MRMLLRIVNKSQDILETCGDEYKQHNHCQKNSKKTITKRLHRRYYKQ